MLCLPFFFMHILNISVVKTGFFITPWPIGIALSAPLAGFLSEKYSATLLGCIGLSSFGIGLILLANLIPASTTSTIIIAMATCGFGFGFFQAPNNKILLDHTPSHRSGAAGGLIATTRLLGQTIGATLAALIFGLPYTSPNRSILWVSSAIAFFAAILYLLSMRALKKSTN